MAPNLSQVRFIYEYLNVYQIILILCIGCEIEANQALMGADHPNRPVLPDIDACMRHCNGKSNYFVMAGNGGTCYCKTTITQRKTVAGWFSGTTACANGKLILVN